MSLLPRAVVHASVGEEMAAAQAWARRHDHELDFDETELRLAIELFGAAKADGVRERYLLTGYFDDYRAIPPAWTFVHPDTRAEVGPPAFPQPAPGRIQSSIFLTSGALGAVICAPFNRLAYSELGGPHGDWGSQTNWLHAAPDYTRAETIADMLARIATGVSETTTRMAPLP